MINGEAKIGYDFQFLNFIILTLMEGLFITTYAYFRVGRKVNGQVQISFVFKKKKSSSSSRKMFPTLFCPTALILKPFDDGNPIPSILE